MGFLSLLAHFLGLKRTDIGTPTLHPRYIKKHKDKVKRDALVASRRSQ